MRARRCELLGTARDVRGISFSERSEPVLDDAQAAEVLPAFVEALAAGPGWDEWLASYTPRDGAMHQLLRQLQSRCGGYLRETDFMEAWEVPLDGGFEAWLGTLGAGTRARVMGSRRRLERAGTMQERVLGPDELAWGWEVFARLHQDRWGRPFSAYWSDFYGEIAAMQAARGIPVMAVLELDGEPVSVMVNFRAGRREYAMVSAFRPVAVPRVSPGWLHFGLAIERACADGISCFDLLGGAGKNEQYKAAFGGVRSELVCLQLLRDARLAVAYRARDGLRDLRDRVRKVT